jgi:hypothetical protein
MRVAISVLGFVLRVRLPTATGAAVLIRREINNEQK